MTDLEFRFSSTDTYLACRRRYMLDYVFEISPVPYEGRQGTAAEVGTMGHAGLAELYRGKSDALVYNAVDKSALDLGLLGRAGHIEAKSAVERYLAWHKRTNADRHMRILDVERRFRSKLFTEGGFDVYLSGALDVLWEDDIGGLHILDHKFGASLARLAKSAERSSQGKTYAWLVQQVTGREVESFTLNMILRKPLKTKPSLLVDRVTKYIDLDEQKQHIADLIVVAREMFRLQLDAIAGNEENAVPHFGEHCGWCPHAEACSLLSRNRAEAQKLLSDPLKYRVKEPY